MFTAYLIVILRYLQVSRIALVVSVMLASIQLLAQAQGKEPPMEYPTFYRTIQIDGLSIFYREAGPKDAPTLLLLHGLRHHRGCSSRSSPGFPIAITLWRPITPALDTATGRTRKNSRIRSITMPRS